jgi:hypothetical protein
VILVAQQLWLVRNKKSPAGEGGARLVSAVDAFFLGTGAASSNAFLDAELCAANPARQ